MKFLCICMGGNVRSVALAQKLKEMGHEAIAIGIDYTEKDTLLMLSKWADRIIDVREYIKEDKWHDARNPELLKLIDKICKGLFYKK